MRLESEYEREVIIMWILQVMCEIKVNKMMYSYEREGSQSISVYKSLNRKEVIMMWIL